MIGFLLGISITINVVMSLFLCFVVKKLKNPFSYLKDIKADNFDDKFWGE